MIMKLLKAIAVIFTCTSVFAAVQTRTIQRSCVVNNVHYTVKYAYDENGPIFVSLQNPIGRLHWNCRVTVMQGTNQVGEPFSGVFTEQGCFEDVPKDMVVRAMSSQNPSDTPMDINGLGRNYALSTPTNHGWGTLVANRTTATNLWPVITDRNFQTPDLPPVPNDMAAQVRSQPKEDRQAHASDGFVKLSNLIDRWSRGQLHEDDIRMSYPTNYNVLQTDPLWTNFLWGIKTAVSNSVYDPFKDVRDGLNSYRRAYSNDVPPWWESRDGAVVTDTNIVRMINAWHKLKE